MKKLLYTIFALLSLSACSKNEENDIIKPVISMEKITAYAQQEESRISRDGVTIKWEKDDIVKVFNSEGKSFELKVTSVDSTGKATLEGEVESGSLKDEDTYTATFGSLAETAFAETGKINFQIPASQGGSYDSSIALYGNSGAGADYHNLTLSLKPVNSVFTFTVPEVAGTVSKLTFRGLNNENIAGNYSYNGAQVANDLDQAAIVVENPESNEITIAVPAGVTFTKGYSVSYVAANGSSIAAYGLSGIEGGKVYVKDLTFNPFTLDLNVNTNWEDFKAKRSSSLGGEVLSISGSWNSAQNSVISKAEVDYNGTREEVSKSFDLSKTVTPGKYRVKLVITDIYGEEYTSQTKEVVVLDHTKIGLTMTSPKSSYSYYTGSNGATQNTSTANAMGGKEIDETGNVSINDYCPMELLDDIGYILDGTKTSKGKENRSITIAGNDNADLKAYTYQGYCIIDGKEIRTEEDPVHVTGIPYNTDKYVYGNGMNNGEWVQKSGGKYEINNNPKFLRIGSNGSVTMTLHIPGDINTNISYRIDEYLSSRFNYCKTGFVAGGTTILDTEDGGTATTKKYESNKDIKFTSTSNNIVVSQKNGNTPTWGSSHPQLYYISILYK